MYYSNALVYCCHWLGNHGLFVLAFFTLCTDGSCLNEQLKMPLEIGFAGNEIVINTLIRRRYQWTDFNNIILKDDLLTLDFKNNRLLQRETIDEEGDADEHEFNLYCQEQMKRLSVWNRDR